MPSRLQMSRNSCVMEFQATPLIVVLHDRLEPDPDRREFEGLGTGPEATGEQMEGGGQQEASERAGVVMAPSFG